MTFNMIFNVGQGYEHKIQLKIPSRNFEIIFILLVSIKHNSSEFEPNAGANRQVVGELKFLVGETVHSKKFCVKLQNIYQKQTTQNVFCDFTFEM